MFTGLVERTGIVVSARQGGAGRFLEIDVAELAQGLSRGDSVCVNGACLTATAIRGPVVAFDVSKETVEKTTLGSFRPGRRVNLERALRAGQPIGGHFVQGHVDGRGAVLSLDRRPMDSTLRVSFDPDLLLFIVEKGSVAVDGVSLTVSSLADSDFTVALIPETLEATTIGSLKQGDAVNVETDMLGKYIVGWLQRGTRNRAANTGGGIDMGMLGEHGFA